MKDFLLDSASVGDRAKAAAAKPDFNESFVALRSVFQDCGHVAGAYADPDVVVRALVAHVVEEWQAGRRVLAGVS